MVTAEVAGMGVTWTGGVAPADQTEISMPPIQETPEWKVVPTLSEK